MHKKELEKLLEDHKSGTLDTEQLIKQLTDMPFKQFADFHMDHLRELKKGFPEVIWAQNKTVKQVTDAYEELKNKSKRFLLTRMTDEQAEALNNKTHFAFDAISRVGIYEEEPLPKKGHIIVIGAGTSDMPVVKEAELVAETMGNKVTTIIDVGVAGIHRLLAYYDKLQEANVIIAVAGMEGALVSVVAGLVKCPVIAVPTSVGYGSHLQGIAPLLSMLNSCAPNVSVVNIDNGFGAAYQASLINHIGEE
ncbi:nickel pincer cofactor biosynthesis protein LarB [Candidatus Woesearchaeota archaeon]|nr:nickel pincer cofactor biosynthesis protein LarB [Candidatus Woesearchaeota archaeon]